MRGKTRCSREPERGVAGDVSLAARMGGQLHDGSSHLFGILDRRHRVDRSTELVRGGLEMLRVHRVGKDGANVDVALVGELGPQRLRDPAQAELADDVRRDDGLPDLAQDGPHVDQDARVLSAKDGHYRPGAQDRPVEVRLDHPAVFLELALLEQREERDSGVVDPDIDAPARVERSASPGSALHPRE